MGNVKSKDKGITSLEILEQINMFRKEEGNRTELRHDTLLEIIRDEFEKEISLQKILESKYKNSRGKEYPMFILSLGESKQILVRESKFVRKAMIQYIEQLENKILSKNIPKSYAEALLEAGRIALENEKLEIENKVKQEKIERLTHINKLYTSTEIAKELNFRSANLFNLTLEKKGIQYKVNSTWVLKSEYSSFKYVSIKQNVLDSGKVIYDRKWTQEGRDFLIEKFK